MTTQPTTDSAAAEIDRIRAEYNRRRREIDSRFYAWNRPVNYFFHTQLSRLCIATLERERFFPLDDLKLADIGCGPGTWLLEFAQWGANRLAGIDLDETRLQQARARLPRADLLQGDAGHLPWRDHTFDLVTQFTVFTSVLREAVKQRMAAEMVRVLRPNGIILWYDFRRNNPWNPSVHGIEAAEIRQLFPNCRIRLQSVTLAPPLARAIVPLSWTAALILETVPFLRTHYLAVIRKAT